MDAIESVKILLGKWSMPDRLIGIFKENEIDEEALFFLETDDIKLLFKEESLGLRIKFTKKLNEWKLCKKSKNSTKPIINKENNSQNDPSTSKGIITNSQKSILLMDILKTTPTGHCFINIIEKKESMSDQQRAILIEHIVTYFMNNDKSMGVNECQDIANQIEKHFKNEIANIYFQRRPNNSKSKGKLYDKYNNRVAKLRGLLPKAKRQRAEIKSPEFSVYCNNIKYNLKQ